MSLKDQKMATHFDSFSLLMRAPKSKIQKPGGSVLKRLKTDLESHGLIGQHALKRGSKKKLKKKDVDVIKERAEKLKQFQSKINPFELKVNRQKFDIFGKTVKGSVGKPGVSRKVAFENREKTLKIEMERKNKVNSVIDRRFGEDDPNLTVEDKMLERFAREKRKRAEKSMVFNLNDDEEEMELTHYGQSLSHLDDIAEHDPRLHSDDEQNLNGEMVDAMHFGGFEESDKKKSHADVMKEIIAKSKFHRIERQKTKQENEELRRDLNDDFNAIRGLLMEASEKNIEEIKAAKKLEPPKPDVVNDENYDVLVKSLAFEKRARPSDRLKTEEELIKKEAERLAELERQRLRRMHGEDTLEEKRVPGGDDLHDDFELEQAEKPSLVYRNGKLAVKGKVDTSDPSEDEEDEGSGGDSECDSEEGDSELDEEEDEDDSEMEPIAQIEEYSDEEAVSAPEDEVDKQVSDLEQEQAPVDPVIVDEEAAKELPYTFDCPETYEQLANLLAGRTFGEQDTILERLMVLYHKSLKAENKAKLQQILKLLVYHVELLAKHAVGTKTNPSLIKTVPSEISSFAPFHSALEHFLPHIFKLAAWYPQEFGEIAFERVDKFQQSMTRRAKHSQPLVQFQQLIMLAMFTRVFSVSDLFHPVITPMVVMISQSLELLCKRKMTKNDMATGLFMCQLIYQIVVDSMRFVPECLNFLLLSLYLLVKNCVPEPHKNEFTFPDSSVDGLLSLDELNQVEFNGKYVDVFFEDASYATFLGPVLATLDSFMELYKSKEFQEVDSALPISALVNPPLQTGWSWIPLFQSFKPLVESLDATIDDKSYTQALLSRFASLTQKILEKHHDNSELLGSSRARVHLQLQKQKARALTLFNPKFELNYSADKHYDPNRDRLEKKKLEAMHRREKKGALRELKKDARFIATEQIKRKKEASEEYKKKMRKVYGQLGDEQAEVNAEKRRKK